MAGEKAILHLSCICFQRFKGSFLMTNTRLTPWSWSWGFRLLASPQQGGHDAIWLTKSIGFFKPFATSTFDQLQYVMCTVHIFFFSEVVSYKPKKIAKEKSSIYIYINIYIYMGIYIYTLHTCFFWRIHENTKEDIHQQRKPKRAQVFRGHRKGYQPPPCVSWVEIVHHKLGMGHLRIKTKLLINLLGIQDVVQLKMEDMNAAAPSKCRFGMVNWHPEAGSNWHPFERRETNPTKKVQDIVEPSYRREIFPKRQWDFVCSPLKDRKMFDSAKD